MKESVLYFNSKHRYYTNLSHERVSPLYEYFKARLGTLHFPLSDRQRFAFDKMIVNMCAERELPINYDMLSNPRINFYSGSYWREWSDEAIDDISGYAVPYGEVREEMNLLNRIVAAGNVIPADADPAVLERIASYDHCPVVREIMATA